MFDGNARTRRFRFERLRPSARSRCFFERAAKTDFGAARDAMEPDPRAQRRHASRGRRDCSAGNSVVLQPAGYGRECGRYRNLANFGPNRSAELARLSLGRKNRPPWRAKEELKIEGRLARWLTAFGVYLLKFWERTLRYQVEDHAQIAGAPIRENFIGALWHNRLLIFPLVLRRFFPNRNGAALISASRDGDLLTDAIQRFGFDVVRGSSSRLGASALFQLGNVLSGKRDVVITPDGPRGPVYELGQGIIFLAQTTGVRVLPMNLEYSSCWRVKSWDRFIIPRPFSKIRVIIGEPRQIKSTSTPEEFEGERLLLQMAMMSLVERR